MNYSLILPEPFPGRFAFCPVAWLGRISEMKGCEHAQMPASLRVPGSKAFLEAAAAALPGRSSYLPAQRHGCKPKLARYAARCQVCSTNPSGFGTSCDPLGPSTSPVETKAAFLLSLGVTTALRRYGAKCGDHDAISTQTCSKSMCFSSILSPWLPEHVTDQACEAPLPTAGKRVLQGGNPKST